LGRQERHEADFPQVYPFDDTNAPLILVQLPGYVEAAEVLGVADRASADGRSTEARPEPLVQGEDAAVHPPELAAVVAREWTAESALD
jgi:hypothetical protein